MNVYYVDGGDYERISYDPPDWEAYRLAGIFCADTPGQAKWDALREFNNNCEYLDFKVRLLGKNLDLPRGVFDEEPPPGLWDDPDSGVDPPEPWNGIWLALNRVHSGEEQVAELEQEANRGRPRPDYDPRTDWPERYGRV